MAGKLATTATMSAKETILQRIQRISRTESSAVFGDLCVQELSRAQFRAIGDNARMDDTGNLMHVDRWNGGIFASGVVDPETKEPLFTLNEILDFPERDQLWDEVRRVADVILALSEVGPESLKSGDPAPDA